MAGNRVVDVNRDDGRIGFTHAQVIALFLMVYDAVAVTGAFFLALLLRFDFRFSMIPSQYFIPWARFAPLYAVMCVAVFYVFRLYKSIWRFASYTELERMVLATFVTGVFHIVLITVFFGRMPISYYMMGIVLQFVFTTGVRFAYRFVLLLRGARDKGAIKNIMVIGAGAAGQLILRDIKSTPDMNEKAVCIIDDNKNKWNRDIDGVPVVGGRGSIIESAVKYDVDKIYVAIPSASNQEKKKILELCNETKCELMNLPGMYQLAQGKVSVSSLRKVDVEDLLGREPVQLLTDDVQKFLYGKTVIVTGGGGSIGSEICRQVAATEGVKQLIVFDIYENNAHAIQLELNDKYPDLDLVVLIGSVRNTRRLNQVFSKYRPDICFHAAAHKHVPLMEGSPNEAIKNNCMGTYNTAYAAMAYGCSKFVLISTDKAVNPVNVMGASKRICEMIVQTFADMVRQGKAHEIPDMEPDIHDLSSPYDHPEIPEHPVTEFSAVRFGNVLGSNGSVVPRFREQIAKGGPVTVTHPDIIRYFMTIPEAAALVLQAAAMGEDANIYVLDMGTPVKIDDMARNMIKLAGLQPDVDIKIEYTGLRPGEKLFEERLMDEEGLKKTANDRISIGHPIELDHEAFLKELRILTGVAYSEAVDIRKCIAAMVPTYKPAGEHGTEEKNRKYMELRQTMNDVTISAVLNELE